jgi:tRNA threonylcarbamoyladenosine biosynthesis protein TsaB
MILCIETATNVCSVALIDRDRVIGIKESSIDKSHASLLSVFIEELLSEQKIKAQSLDAVAVSMGPGSYTGLRIGVSTAKGICFGAGLPLIAINTLKSMYYGAVELYSSDPEINTKTLYCPMIDARRMEVYSSLYDSKGNEIREVQAEIITEDSYMSFLEESPILFFGNGSDKCLELINHTNTVFRRDYQLSASSLAIPALYAFDKKDFADIAYFEPYYLKDFVATIPRKNILGK